MAGTLNKAQILGNVGKDPEVRSFQNGGKVANFSIATSDKWKDKATGELKERTQWHRIAVFNEHLVEIIEKYVVKGSKVYVEGQIETREWEDKDGEKKYTTEIVLRPYNGSIILLGDSKRKGDDDTGTDRATNSSGTNATGRSTAANNMDDEIPF